MGENVLRNSAVNKVRFAVKKKDLHKLRIYSEASGMIVQKIVIDCGGLKKSYSGPNETFVSKE